MSSPFFLAIRQHEGVYYHNHRAIYSKDASDEFCDFLLNLSLVNKIYFDVDTIAQDLSLIETGADRTEYPSIQFISDGSDDPIINFFLLFKARRNG